MPSSRPTSILWILNLSFPDLFNSYLSEFPFMDGSSFICELSETDSESYSESVPESKLAQSSSTSFLSASNLLNALSFYSSSNLMVNLTFLAVWGSSAKIVSKICVLTLRNPVLYILRNLSKININFYILRKVSNI